MYARADCGASRETLQKNAVRAVTQIRAKDPMHDPTTTAAIAEILGTRVSKLTAAHLTLATGPTRWAS